jgi:hypothetical protein
MKGNDYMIYYFCNSDSAMGFGNQYVHASKNISTPDDIHTLEKEIANKLKVGKIIILNIQQLPI